VNYYSLLLPLFMVTLENLGCFLASWGKTFRRFGILRVSFSAFEKKTPVTCKELGHFVFLKSSIAHDRSRSSAVGIADGCRLDDRGVGVRVPVGSIIFTSPYRPDRLWGPPNILSNGHRVSFPGGKAAGARS
jgi:hypothetical protein